MVRNSTRCVAFVAVSHRQSNGNSRETLATARGIRVLLQETKPRLRRDLPKHDRQDLLNNLFRYPHTKIEFMERDLGISCPTATQHLGLLEKAGFVRKTQWGRTSFYVNEPRLTLRRPGVRSPRLAPEFQVCQQQNNHAIARRMQRRWQ